MTDEYTVILAQVEALQNSIFQFLRRNKVQVPDKKIKSLLQGLEDIQTIVPGHKYVAVERNELGYITAFTIADGVSTREAPADLMKGYYTMDENGRFILDENKKERFLNEL